MPPALKRPVSNGSRPRSSGSFNDADSENVSELERWRHWLPQAKCHLARGESEHEEDRSVKNTETMLGL